MPSPLGYAPRSRRAPVSACSSAARRSGRERAAGKMRGAWPERCWWPTAPFLRPPDPRPGVAKLRNQTAGEGGGIRAPPSLLILPGGKCRRPARLRSRVRDRKDVIHLFRLEDTELHGVALLRLDSDRWRWSAQSRLRRYYRGRLKAAAPQPLTTAPVRASAQKARVRGRRPKDKSRIR